MKQNPKEFAKEYVTNMGVDISRIGFIESGKLDRTLERVINDLKDNRMYDAIAITAEYVTNLDTVMSEYVEYAKFVESDTLVSLHNSQGRLPIVVVKKKDCNLEI